MRGIILNEKNIGLPPGTPVYVGDRPALAMKISVLTYNSSFAEIKDVLTVDELPQSNDDAIMWININGLKDIDSIKKLAKTLDIHSLTVEDVLNTKQQPKTENFEKYRFISFKSIRQEKKLFQIQDTKKGFIKLKSKKNEEALECADDLIFDQICIIIMKNVLITFQEMTGDPFDGIRKRILENMGQIRLMGTDYLAYSLIDAVVDRYYLSLSHIEDEIDDFEDRAIKTNDDTFITEVQDAKKYLFRIRHAMLPLRDNLMNIYRRIPPVPTPDLTPFLQDLHENLNNAIDTVETYREWLSNVMDVNLSVLSYQLNKVMKILTVISSIFIPLTFIAGVYGMNFQVMPELSIPWAYPAVLILMGLIALGMIVFIKLRRW